MPKIPISTMPEPIRHQSGAIQFHGAPDLNWKVKEKTVLLDTMNSFYNAASTTMGLAGQQLRISKEYQRQAQDQENKLAAIECQNLYNEMYGTISNEMRENPGQIDNFGERRAEMRELYAERSKEHLDKMTPEYRKIFEAEMAGKMSRGEQDLDRVVVQAKVTNMYNSAKEQWRQAASRGDHAMCKDILDQFRGTLFSEEEARVLEQDYHRISEGCAARDLVEAGDPEMPEKLEAKDAAGNFVNYKNITIDYREQLTRRAKQIKNERETAYLDKVAGDLKQGKCTLTEAKLGEMRDAHEISDSVYNNCVTMVRARDEGVAKLNAARKKEAEEAEQRTLKQRADAFCYRVEIANFSSDPAVNAQQKNSLYQAAAQMFAGHPDKLSDIYKLIKTRAAAGLSGEDEFSSPEGKLVLKHLEESWDLEFPFSPGDLLGDAVRFDAIEYARSKLAKGVPASTINKNLDELYVKVAGKGIARILDTATGATNYRKNIARDAQTASLMPGDIVDGCRYVGGDPNNQSSWQEVEEEKK